MHPLKYSLKYLLLVFCAFLLISSFYSLPSNEVVSVRSSAEVAEFAKPELSPQERSVYLKQQQQVQRAIDDYFKNALKKGLIVGAGVSVVKGDSVLLATGYGMRNAKTKDAADGETVFRLGSLSKGFAGVLAGKLKSEGLLDWNDKVCDYLPEFQFKEGVNTEKITLSHLLSHTSGAPYHSYTDLIEDGVNLKTIAASFKKVNPVSKPGELYSYQNALFAMTGEATKSITGNSINTDLQKNFFTPLNMTSTSTDHEGLMATENKAYPHSKYRRGWKPRKLNDHYYNAVAAGGINASATDMAQWMHLLLGHKENIMSAETLSEVFKPQIKIPGRRKYYQRWEGHQASYYAYGWRVHEFADEEQNTQTMIHHGGSVNNFRNEIALFPESDLGICVLMNSMTPLASHVIPDLKEIVLEILNDTTTGALLAAQ